MGNVKTKIPNNFKQNYEKKSDLKLTITLLTLYNVYSSSLQLTKHCRLNKI